MSAASPPARSMRRSSLALALTGVVALSGVLPGSMGAAQAAVDQSPAATYQTNGTVSAIVVVGNRVYVGGLFTNVRPAGAPDGTDVTPRRGLAAFNLTTGALLPWNPDANSQVNALAASPNGKVIYVGGRFRRVDGLRRTNLAAVRARSGHLTKFRADTNRRVLSIATRGKNVYVGGKFTLVRRHTSRHVVALTPRGHVRRSFHGSTDGFVRGIAVGPRGRVLFLGGDFRHVDGRHSLHLAKVSSSGRLQHLRSHPRYPVNELVLQRQRLYVAGNGVGGHVASYTTAGRFRWVRQTDGNVASVATIRKTVYVGGQFHNICVGNTAQGGSGFTCPTVQGARQRLLAVSKAHGGLSAWDPGANNVFGVFALVGTPSALHVGGDFTALDASDQQGYGRFDLP